MKGRVPEHWVPDRYALSCFECGERFTVVIRKHHCRACGRVFCRRCMVEGPASSFFTRRQLFCKLCVERRHHVAASAAIADDVTGTIVRARTLTVADAPLASVPQSFVECPSAGWSLMGSFRELPRKPEPEPKAVFRLQFSVGQAHRSVEPFSHTRQWLRQLEAREVRFDVASVDSVSTAASEAPQELTPLQFLTPENNAVLHEVPVLFNAAVEGFALRMPDLCVAHLKALVEIDIVRRALSLQLDADEATALSLLRQSVVCVAPQSNHSGSSAFVSDELHKTPTMFLADNGLCSVSLADLTCDMAWRVVSTTMPRHFDITRHVTFLTIDGGRYLGEHRIVDGLAFPGRVSHRHMAKQRGEPYSLFGPQSVPDPSLAEDPFRDDGLGGEWVHVLLFRGDLGHFKAFARMSMEEYMTAKTGLLEQLKLFIMQWSPHVLLVEGDVHHDLYKMLEDEDVSIVSTVGREVVDRAAIALNCDTIHCEDLAWHDTQQDRCLGRCRIFSVQDVGAEKKSVVILGGALRPQFKTVVLLCPELNVNKAQAAKAKMWVQILTRALRAAFHALLEMHLLCDLGAIYAPLDTPAARWHKDRLVTWSLDDMRRVAPQRFFNHSMTLSAELPSLDILKHNLHSTERPETASPSAGHHRTHSRGRLSPALDRSQLESHPRVQTCIDLLCQVARAPSISLPPRRLPFGGDPRPPSQAPSVASEVPTPRPERTTASTASLISAVLPPDGASFVSEGDGATAVDMMEAASDAGFSSPESENDESALPTDETVEGYQTLRGVLDRLTWAPGSILVTVVHMDRVARYVENEGRAATPAPFQSMRPIFYSDNDRPLRDAVRHMIGQAVEKQLSDTRTLFLHHGRVVVARIKVAQSTVRFSADAENCRPVKPGLFDSDVVVHTECNACLLSRTQALPPCRMSVHTQRLSFGAYLEWCFYGKRDLALTSCGHRLADRTKMELHFKETVHLAPVVAGDPSLRVVDSADVAHNGIRLECRGLPVETHHVDATVAFSVQPTKVMRIAEPASVMGPLDQGVYLREEKESLRHIVGTVGEMMTRAAASNGSLLTTKDREASKFLSMSRAATSHPPPQPLQPAPGGSSQETISPASGGPASPGHPSPVPQDAFEEVDRVAQEVDRWSAAIEQLASVDQCDEFRVKVLYRRVAEFAAAHRSRFDLEELRFREHCLLPADGGLLRLDDPGNIIFRALTFPSEEDLPEDSEPAEHWGFTPPGTPGRASLAKPGHSRTDSRGLSRADTVDLFLDAPTSELLRGSLATPPPSVDSQADLSHTDGRPSPAPGSDYDTEHVELLDLILNDGPARRARRRSYVPAPADSAASDTGSDHTFTPGSPVTPRQGTTAPTPTHAAAVGGPSQSFCQAEEFLSRAEALDVLARPIGDQQRTVWTHSGLRPVASGGTRRCKVTSVYPKQFAALRYLYTEGEPKRMYRSLRRCQSVHVTGGRSAARFFASCDDQLVVKRVSEPELASLRELWPRYFELMARVYGAGQVSVLCKVFGIYKVSRPETGMASMIGMEQSDIYIVMQKLFDAGKMSLVYDLKGSQLHRRANPGSTLLDENVVSQIQEHDAFFFCRPETRDSLLAAVTVDSELLRDADCMDYSLVVGVDENNDCLRVGVIDFMRKFNLSKKIETLLKRAVATRGPTVQPPPLYHKRFIYFMSLYFCPVPDRLTGLRHQLTPERLSAIDQLANHRRKSTWWQQFDSSAAQAPFMQSEAVNSSLTEAQMSGTTRPGLFSPAV